MNILIVIPSLHAGGTERQAVALANGLKSKGHTINLATLYPHGELEKELDKVLVHSVDKRGRWDMLRAMGRLKGIIEDVGAEVVYTFLGTPNIMGAMLKPLCSSRLVWGMRASEMHLANYDWCVRLAHYIELALSRMPDLIICNSNAGKSHAAALGYPRHLIQIVPNGIDTETFKPDEEARTRTRTMWGIPEGAWLVGLPARIDPIKDHPTFLRAARLALNEEKHMRFVCIGGGSHSYAESLKALACDLGLADSVLWTGHQQDMVAAYNALDMACLSSLGEGLPNALCEAMACGKPCVSTDVGDAKAILGSLGTTVPAGDSAALGEAFIGLRKRIRKDPSLSQQCRARIVSGYGLNAMIKETLRQLEGLTVEGR